MLGTVSSVSSEQPEHAIGRSTSTKPSVAVLPFINRSDEKDKDYSADGLAGDIVTGLSVAKHLSVKSRSSTFNYKDQSPDVRQVGRELGVTYVVEGSIRPVSDRVRITAQLIEAEAGDHLWAKSYHCSAADLFDVQDEVIASITSALGATLTKAERAHGFIKTLLSRRLRGGTTRVLLPGSGEKFRGRNQPIS